MHAEVVAEIAVQVVDVFFQSSDLRCTRQNGILRRFHWSVRRANGLAMLVGDGLAFAIVVCQYLVHFVIGKGLGATVGFPFLCGFIFCISKLFQCDSADRY